MQTTTETKMRSSATRNSIYAYLCGTKEHPSAEMIYNDLKADIPNLSLGTVYRNLKQLEEIGRVIRVTKVNNYERYDANCEDHVHFVCERCGRVIDIMDADIHKATAALNIPNGSKVKRLQIVIEGTCGICSAEN
ncbi:MAG: transcriptional repressor [Clostridia bacterium]|nr:transcriptional repressor [Clostridia bacterium]